MNAAPMTYRYQDSRLRRGNATSGAPIIIGSMKLPMVDGIDGTKKNHTMMMPCIVKRRLYSSEVRNSPVGLTSSSRTRCDGHAADEEK